MLRHLSKLFRTPVSAFDTWAFPPMGKRRQRFILKFNHYYLKAMAPVGSIAVAGIIIWALLSADESVAFAIGFGLMMGILTFFVLILGTRFFTKYIIPAQLALSGFEPPPDDTPPWRGEHRKRSWLIYIALGIALIWMTFSFWVSKFGFWGIVIIFAGFGWSVFAFKRVPKKMKALTKTMDNDETKP